MKIVVTPDAFAMIPSVRRRLTEAVVMEVVSIRTSPYAKSRPLFHGSDVVYLYSRQTGHVGVPAYMLISSMYASPDFEAHAPYKPGEYVQLGRDWDDKLVLAKEGFPDSTVTISSYAAPYLGRFLGVTDKEHYRLEIQAKGQLAPTNILAPKGKVQGLSAGTRKAASASIRELPLSAPAFSPGERVRYRDDKGLMREGIFRATAGGISEIETRPGATARVASRQAFKSVGDVPASTPFYDPTWATTRLNPRDPLVMELLDGAALLSSHPDFPQASPMDRLLLLTHYIQRSVPWTKAATEADLAGLDTFAKLITAGAAVCRHNAYLAGVVFSEAGYVTRLVIYRPPEAAGHAWLEVDIRQWGGVLRTYVVDPSNDAQPVQDLGAVMKSAKSSGSSAAKWYLQPGRQYSVAQPIP